MIIDIEAFKKLKILEDRMKVEQLREALKGEKRQLRKLLEDLELAYNISITESA